MEGLTLPSGLPWGGVATGDRSPYWPCAYPRKGKSNISVKLHKSCPNVLHIIECCRQRRIPVWEKSGMKSPLLIWCLWAVPGALVTLGASSNTCSTRKYGKRNKFRMMENFEKYETNLKAKICITCVSINKVIFIATIVAPWRLPNRVGTRQRRLCGNKLLYYRLQLFS